MTRQARTAGPTRAVLGNHGQRRDHLPTTEATITAAVPRTRDAALTLAREHLGDLFVARKGEVESRRQEFFRRLESWHSGATRLVQEEKAALRANGITRGPRYEAADQKARQIEDRLLSRKDWAEQILDPGSKSW